MRKSPGTSWERFGRRFELRLSLKNQDEKDVMDEYDRRSLLLGKNDKEFMKSCLIAGFKILYKTGNDSSSVALSNNESNNTQTEHSQESLENVSCESVLAESAVADAVPKGSGVPAKSVLGGLMRHA
jgi:hypothetical protein